MVLCAPNVARRPTNTNRLFSLGLLYLRAAAERAGWTCYLVDAYFDDLSDADCARRIAMHRPALVGYSAVSELMFQSAARVHAQVESRAGGRLPCVAGGHFPTRRPQQAFEGCDALGWIVAGEGEVAFEGLLRHLAGETATLDTLPNLLTRVLASDGPVRPRRRSTVADLDAVGDYDERWMDARIGADEWSLVTSRGCTARCSFCVIGPHWRRYGEWRGHSAEWVADRIVRLRDRGARYVQIVDDQFVGSPASLDRARRICELLEGQARLPRLGIMCRPDVVLDNADVFEKLRAVGLSTVFMGLETGSNEIARRLRKETTVEVGAAAVARLHRIGLEVQSGTIFFHPWMTLQTLRQDIGYFRGLMDACSSFRILGINELDILPRTPLAAAQGNDSGQWQLDWADGDAEARAVYRRWLGYQSAILFPALDAVARAPSGNGRGAAAARLQLDALEHLVRAQETAAPEAQSATLLQFEASRFVARLASPEQFREYLLADASPEPAGRELERCFDRD